jgi:Protein of unknown function (DUF2971)
MTEGARLAPPRAPNLDPLIAQVLSLDYRKLRQFLRRGLQTPYPRFLYKYKPLAEGDAADAARYLRDILVESHLWLSSPKDFNDPFDLTAHVIFEGSTEAKRRRFERLIAQRNQPPEEARRQLAYAIGLPDSEWLVRAKQTVSSNLQKTGVYSFAGNPRSLLMWSHYGGRHSGICLQFEIAKDPQTMLHAVPARYVEAYPVVNWVEDTIEQIKGALLHKFKKWKYEKERRIIWPEGARSRLPFDPSALVGVIFGCRASIAAMDVVRAMLEERRSRGLPTARVYHAHQHDSEYSLVVKTPLTAPWQRDPGANDE